MSVPADLTLPILPLKNAVLFPYMFVPFSVSRPFSLAAIQAAYRTEDKMLALIAQRELVPEPKTLGVDLYTIGTRATIKKMSQNSDRVDILVEGIERISLLHLESTDPYLKGKFNILPFPQDKGAEVEALHRSILELAGKILQASQPKNNINISQLADLTDDPLQLAYMLASMLSFDVQKEQAILEANTVAEALRLLHQYMAHEMEVLELRQKIASTAQTEINKQQREYILRQQLRAIQEELGEMSSEKSETEDLRKKYNDAKLPEGIQKEILRDLNRLEHLPSAAPDSQIMRNYIEFVLDLPWNKSTVDHIDLKSAHQVLDEDHYGLQDVKDRILEHLSILKLNPKAKPPLFCFVGPPGVGKTSLGQSIARALGRKFERMSLGGMHDEAELRGHRRTYIGAMPGRILQAIRRAGVNNPLLMLDEVDKIGHDFRGDPAFALLEILDPAQNHTFRDNYLDLPFDLSNILFITTANTLDTIARPLLDRMEILTLTGYTDEEKVQIARRYLLPRRLENAGIHEDQLKIPEEALKFIINAYTHESGVRELERIIGRVASKVARQFAEGQVGPIEITISHLTEYLGSEKFRPERARIELPPGVAPGLAVTPVGGEILYVEASLLPLNEELRLTGQLGDVMRESAKAAQTYIWSNLERWKIDSSTLKKHGLHIHVPAGAIPKDGPSAGVAMVAAIASTITRTSCRSDTAMTGEITLSGLVLPVGGIKEKVLAARRAKIFRIVIPKDNEKDLRDIPEEARKEMQFVLVDKISDALDAVLPTIFHRIRPLAAS